MKTKIEIQQSAETQVKYHGAVYTQAVALHVIADALIDIRDLLQKSNASGSEATAPIKNLEK